ncbi:MAG TPA: hypothetical protein VGL56_16865 [Fimbriimonadaceae bacterium]|jgi:hypothetical protein
MNEFKFEDLKVGDRISRECWTTFGVVERIERGIGTDSEGQTALVPVKVFLRIGDMDDFDMEELAAEDWVRVPPGHEKASRWLTNDELALWLRTGEEPKDWIPPLNKGLKEICADRIESLAKEADHYYKELLCEQTAISRLGYDGMAVYDEAKLIRKELDGDE